MTSDYLKTWTAWAKSHFIIAALIFASTVVIGISGVLSAIRNIHDSLSINRSVQTNTITWHEGSEKEYGWMIDTLLYRKSIVRYKYGDYEITGKLNIIDTDRYFRVAGEYFCVNGPAPDQVATFTHTIGYSNEQVVLRSTASFWRDEMWLDERDIKTLEINRDFRDPWIKVAEKISDSILGWTKTNWPNKQVGRTACPESLKQDQLHNAADHL